MPVGAIRAFDLVADNPGDWAFHCHKSHHTMNAMGHNTRNFIGADQKELSKTIRKLVPDYMPMGSAGMAEVGTMEMPRVTKRMAHFTRRNVPATRWG